MKGNKLMRIFSYILKKWICTCLCLLDYFVNGVKSSAESNMTDE